MKRFLRRIILVVLCICIWSNASVIVFAEDETDLKLYARSAILMDAATGRVLYEENGYAVMPMASTTKIMTCILALESGKLEEYVTVSANAARQPKVRLGIKEGESYLLKDLLYSLMLESHNDTAVAIAEFIGGDVESFADMMNDKALELGCEDTFFITPNGLDATKDGRQHSSTACDMAKITAYALKNDAFREIITTNTYSFMEKNKTKQYTVYNKDAFLTMYEGAVGVKTGFTNGAGYCFVGAVEQGDACFISVVLASGWPPNKSWKWADTKTLMNYGTQNYYYTTFCGDYDYGCIRVEEGIVNEVPLVVMREEIGLLLKENETIEVEYDREEYLTAPVYAGQKVGYERYVLEGEIIAEFPIITAQKAERIHFWYCFGKIAEKFFL